MVVRRIGKYEVGRTIGEGNFGKVKFAQNTETGESVAMKILHRHTILKHNMANQIKTEISIMKLVRHPHIVRLHEVIASRRKIYIILEFVTGGELFDKIVHNGRLREDECRGYFQQLIDGVDYCHSKGVFHRDLKPENLLLDSEANIKISDFGLSALPTHGGEGLLRTTCGTPNYVAPEVLGHKGYGGAAADVWSCGVILYVLMAGYLPFDDIDLPTLYHKIDKAEYSFPLWFPEQVQSLIARILDPDPETRIQIREIRQNEWFMDNYSPIKLLEYGEVDLNGLTDAFANSEEEERVCGVGACPLSLSAFDLIVLSQGLNLSALFDKDENGKGHHVRFMTQIPARVALSTMEVVAQSMGFKTHIRHFKMRVEGHSGDIGVHFSIYEITPSFFMVDVEKVKGASTDFYKFYENFSGKLGCLIWTPG